METLPEIKANIAKLPQTAETPQTAAIKPILAGLAEHLESFTSSLAQMRQESPAHTAGLCAKAECQPCQDARSAVAHQTEDSLITLFDDAARRYGLENEVALLAEAVKQHRAENAQWNPRRTASNSPTPFIEITP